MNEIKLKRRNNIEVVLTDIRIERQRQDAKFGEKRDYTAAFWLAVLAEEFGEASKEVVEFSSCDWDAVKEIRLRNLRTELLQVAAVAVAMVEHIDRGEIK